MSHSAREGVIMYLMNGKVPDLKLPSFFVFLFGFGQKLACYRIQLHLTVFVIPQPAAEPEDTENKIISLIENPSVLNLKIRIKYLSV